MNQDKIYENHAMIQDMLGSMNHNLEILTEKIPRCPECGWKMVPWVQDNTFLQKLRRQIQ